MATSRCPKKMFGVALDPADDPWSLQIKQAWMISEPKGGDRIAACLDRYDAITESLGTTLKKQHIEFGGKFPVPSWLRPKNYGN